MGDRQCGLAISRDEFLRNLSDSGLLSGEGIAALDRLPGAADAADADALARCLTGAGKLTPYQAERVRDRRFEELVIGNYEVLDRLGAGGMGTVFKARHRRMKRVVALKVLSQSLSRDDTFVQRFQREVETIARLTHPNIVMAYDADECEAGHFLVMEYVSGQDLASLVQRQGPLGLSAAVRCVLQAARGLEYAHGQGIIHRDIKPANLLRDTHGAVKVTDLGLARFSSAAGAANSGTGGLTQAGGMLGTVDYMPPEQALDSTAIDHRADVYSLGATLHYLLLGQPPYLGQTMMATLLKHRDAPIPSLCRARGDVPTALDDVFRRMLAKAPADRYPAMSEVAQALEVVLADLGETGATPPAGMACPPDGSTTGPSVPLGQPLAVTTVAPQAPVNQTIDLQPSGTGHGGRRSVLLVEPSRTQSGIIRKYLEAAGVEHVVTVPSGQEALKAVRADPPDAVISAMHLADMTGIQLAQEVRREGQAAAPGFVLISSESEGREAGLLSQSGQAVVLHKPFTAQKLAEALSLASRRFLSLKPPSGATTPPSEVKPTAQPARAPECGQLRVLIADDSAAARAHVRSVLDGLGFTQFVEVPDGAEAVAAVVRETFQLIVTDYNMPHMDGQGLVGFLKQNPYTASVPIIMVTSETDPGKLEAVRRLGVAAICDKSFPAEAVRGIIDRLLC
jgi:serine/threonine protein kinase/DNA-binding response OmpR family regulator